MRPSDAPSTEKRGLKVLGLALAASTNRPPGWMGSPLAMSGDAGRGCAEPCLTPSDLPQPASASMAPSNATREKEGAVIVMHSLYWIHRAQARAQPICAANHTTTSAGLRATSSSGSDRETSRLAAHKNNPECL